MKDKISEYYTHLIKAQYLGISQNTTDVKNAIEECKIALKFKTTSKVYALLINLYIKLKDFNNIEKYCLLNSELDNGYSLYLLGNLYSDPRWRRINYNKAIEYYKKSIDLKKHGPSYISLANFYFSGRSVKKDFDKALSILLEGYKNIRPMYRGEIAERIGQAYMSVQDYKSAVRFFKDAIKKNCTHAYYSLALCYKNGFGVSKNLEKYMELLTSSYCEDAYLEVGSVYMFNKIAPQDLFIFETSMIFASKKGNSTAYIMLAAIEATKQNADNAKIKAYLEKGFAGKKFEDLEKSYSSIEAAFGPEFVEFIKELAKKYWNFEKIEA